MQPNKLLPANKNASKKSLAYKRIINIYKKQKLYKTFFLQGTDWEKTFYKAYANKFT